MPFLLSLSFFYAADHFVGFSAILGSTESRQEKEEEGEVDDAASDTSDLVMRPMDVSNLKTRAFVVNTRNISLLTCTE